MDITILSFMMWLDINLGYLLTLFLFFNYYWCSLESSIVYQQGISNKKLNKLMVDYESGEAC